MSETPETDPLSVMLGAQASAGGVEASGQEFTVNHTTLASRYATFQKEAPAYYLLRVVQGLVRTGAEAIELKLSRTRLELRVQRFAAAVPDWFAPSQLKELLSRPGRWDRTADAVCSGLLCTQGEAFTGVAWSFGGEVLHSPGAEPGEFGVEERPEATDGLVFIVEKKPLFLFSSTGPEHAAAAAQLALGPVPITVDSKLLSPTKPTHHVSGDRWFTEFTGHFFLLEILVGVPVPEEGFQEWSPGFGTRVDGDSCSPFTWYADPQGRSMRCYISLDLDHLSHIFPVIDGVLTNPLKTDKVTGVTAYVDSEELRTDLSGLSLIDKEPLGQRVRALYLPALKLIREHCRKLRAIWGSDYPAYTVSETLGKLSAGADPISIFPLIGLVGGVKIIEIAASWTRFCLVKNSLSDRLVEELERKLDEMIGSS